MEPSIVMRKIINSTYISLDGVIERPHEWPSIGQAAAMRGSDPGGPAAQLRRADHGQAHLRGLRPGLADAIRRPVDDQINSMRKYVVSSTLTDPEWNNTT